MTQTTPTHYQTLKLPASQRLFRLKTAHSARNWGKRSILEAPLWRKWPIQCQPRPFYSQTQQPPCICAVDAEYDTYPPPPVPFCSLHEQRPSPRCIMQNWHKQKQTHVNPTYMVSSSHVERIWWYSWWCFLLSTDCMGSLSAWMLWVYTACFCDSMIMSCLPQ